MHGETKFNHLPNLLALYMQMRGPWELGRSFPGVRARLASVVGRHALSRDARFVRAGSAGEAQGRQTWGPLTLRWALWLRGGLRA
jgi:hypothetical protein